MMALYCLPVCLDITDPLKSSTRKATVSETYDEVITISQSLKNNAREAW